MKHTLHAIGGTGDYSCYLDIPLEEAIQRYEKVAGFRPTAENSIIETIEFEDEFWAYSVGEKA